MNSTVLASLIQPDFTRCISRCFFFLLPVCAGSVGKAKIRKNVSRQYNMCVCLCVFLRVDQMIVVVLFLQRVSMWWCGSVGGWKAVWCLNECVCTCGNWNVCMNPACYRVSFHNSPLRFLLSPTASVIGQWTKKHGGKCTLLYILRGASVVALHAFLWEIKSVAIRSTPQEGQDRRDFCSIDMLTIQGLWVLSCEMMQANLNSDSGCPGHSSGGVTRSSNFNTFYWHWRGVGGSDVELFCHSSFVRVWFGSVQRNESPTCVVMQVQFRLEKTPCC